MEKSTAHYKLVQVQALIAAKRIRFTTSASQGYRGMGLSRREAVELVQRLGPTDFYKSMTTYSDHGIWQDVYHPCTPYGSLYLKLTVVSEVLVVSFKER